MLIFPNGDKHVNSPKNFDKSSSSVLTDFCCIGAPPIESSFVHPVNRPPEGCAPGSVNVRTGIAAFALRPLAVQAPCRDAPPGPVRLATRRCIGTPVQGPAARPGTNTSRCKAGCCGHSATSCTSPHGCSRLRYHGEKTMPDWPLEIISRDRCGSPRS